jgi:Domain of unknown function (DUF4430)
VLRRSLALLVALVAAAALGASAFAAQVHVRVEGETRTIFGAAQPLLAVQANALDALESASLAGEFYYHVQQTSFGPYIDQIGRYQATADSGWVFKVNGVSPPVGADGVTLKDGDSVLWYWATFGPTGGPKTLALTRVKPKGCYRVAAQDDQGVSSIPAGAVLHVDGRRIATKKGVGCVGKHFGLVKATLAGDVRSNALR